MVKNFPRFSTTSAIMERIPSKWPHPVWHPPWKNYREMEFGSAKFWVLPIIKLFATCTGNFTGLRRNTEHEIFFVHFGSHTSMKRVQSYKQWSLFCPNEAPDLADCWGEEFEELYTRYEQQGKAKEVVPAQSLWFEILKARIETGTPYMLFKDTCNRKSNQQNLGTIKSSNLCTEIIEFTSPTETAVCNLASISLPRFVREKAQQLNKDIFETIYNHALKTSSEISAKDGPYETYDGGSVRKVIAESLSEEEIVGLKEMFQSMDIDSSGAITFDELKVGLRRYGSTLKESEIRALMVAVGVICGDEEA